MDFGGIIHELSEFMLASPLPVINEVNSVPAHGVGQAGYGRIIIGKDQVRLCPCRLMRPAQRAV